MSWFSGVRSSCRSWEGDESARLLSLIGQVDDSTGEFGLPVAGPQFSSAESPAHESDRSDRVASDSFAGSENRELRTTCGGGMGRCYNTNDGRGTSTADQTNALSESVSGSDSESDRGRQPRPRARRARRRGLRHHLAAVQRPANPPRRASLRTPPLRDRGPHARPGAGRHPHHRPPRTEEPRRTRPYRSRPPALHHPHHGAGPRSPQTDATGHGAAVQRYSRTTPG